MRINEHIIDYVLQQLPPNEKLIFEKLLKQDRNLAQSVQILKDLKLAHDLEEINAKLDGVWQMHETDMQVEEPIANIVALPTAQRRIPAFHIAAVIVFLLCLGGGGYWIWRTTQSHTVALVPQKNTFTAPNRTNTDKVIKKEELTEDKNQEKTISTLSNNTLAQPHPEKLLALLERTYQDKHIPSIDIQIGDMRGEFVKTPKLDAIFIENQAITFLLPEDEDNLKIEIFTKSTQERPTIYEIEVGNLSFKLSLKSGLYYWRLLRANNEMIHLGRFYVTQ